MEALTYIYFTIYIDQRVNFCSTILVHGLYPNLLNANENIPLIINNLFVHYFLLI